MPDDLTPVPALQEITTSEINTQVATARQYPRDVRKCAADILTMATYDSDVAAACFYRLEKGGSVIEGPSVRLAEIAVSNWGNIRAGSRIVEIGQNFVVAQGICHDLEKNTAVTKEVRRRITKKNGTRYGEDMIQTTCLAAMAIAYRNAVFSVIPAVFVDKAYAEAKKVAVGEGDALRSRWDKMLVAFSKLSVSEPQIRLYLDIGHDEEPTPEHVERMIGVFNGIKDGTTTAKAVFSPVPESSDLANEIADLKDA